MKKALKRTAAACLLTLSVLLSGEAFAQNNVVGRVVDSNNVPLIGVNVVVKGTTTGTTTGVDGNYAIKVAENQTLVFSYLGYTTVEEMVGKRTAINVKMTEEATQLGAVEIVNIGYGTTTRRDLTGSVAKADLGTMMKANVTSFDQALGGRIAGVVVTTGDGSLGAEANITIRGNNSLTQSNAPLYIIDGFPSEGSFATSINPADIESIDVLKDASATAIYGARGANGVIVINTKRGKEGKPTVNFSASFSMSHIANKIDLMDGYEFVRLQDELVSPTSMESSYYSYSEELGRNLTLDDYRNIPGIDWQDELYRTAFQQNYNVSLSGGTKEGLRYNVGFSALDQDGIIIRSNFQRYQGKANFTLPITKKLSLNANVNYSRTATNGVNPTTAETTSSSSGWLMYSVWGYRPVGKPGQDLLNTIIDESVDGSNDYRFNPVKTAQNEYRKTLVDYLNSNIALTWKITPELTFKTTGGYVLNKRRREEFNGTETYTGYPGSPSGKGVNGAIYWTDQSSWTNENTLNYKRRFGRNHNVDMMVGLSLQGQNNTYEGISSTQITSEELGIAGIYTGSYQSVPSNYYDWRMMSMFLRANYNFRYKYYLTFSFRADGSSKFPAGNRWGYFPSVGASWNFNRENLFKKSDWLTNGKLRFSWGLTGNNRTQTPYDFYSQITVTPGSGDSFDYVFDGQRVPGYYFSNMANDRLKWETTEQWNVGIDLGFFDDRLKVTADWYDKVTRDLLLYALLPATSGYEQGMLNIGKIRNRGFEFTLETVNIKTRQFQWSTSFNIAFNRNRILALVDNQNTLQTSVTWETHFNSQFPYISQVNKPTGMMYGFIYDGTYKPEDFDAAGNLRDGIPAYKGNKMQPGDMKYRDMNGDGKIDDYDRTIIGCGQPLHTGGFSNNFTWKNFDLNIFFSWSYGNDILNANRLIFESGWKSQTNQLASYANRWTPSNPTSDTPRAAATGSEEYSSRVIEDGSFLRLKNVSLGYTIPSRQLRKAGISSLRLYVSADNIWTWTNYSGPDPEVSTRNSVLTPGFDWSAYPRAYGFTAGVNITF
ncbi:SusC/RagA family TonB-linked outer membrane protein [Alistipes megaguti]|uniref:SusC/RagA family TonB-linked outer membrane protein n=1 Tax=Alistipes megaguti TaxID=2364787 RepID=UPI0023563E47|nr:TonB-dependent receptor [Alistipes megaguti]